MRSKSEALLPAESGWLFSPEEKLVLFFIRDPKSLIRITKVITQLWHSTDKGIPTQMKNSRTMTLEDAIKIWHKLLNNGWELVEHQINEDAA